MARTRAHTSPRRHADDVRLDRLERELEQWRRRAIPEPNAPLGVEDVARLVRDCFTFFALADAAESFSVNTVHYYRRKDILDEPDGRTAAARYALRHVWQAVGARLAGHLGLVTLAEARDAIRGADEADLRRFVAARIADARARDASRQSTVDARPLVGKGETVSSPLTATVISLGDGAVCLIPSGHAALRSSAGARELVASLARHLGLNS